MLGLSTIRKLDRTTLVIALWNAGLQPRRCKAHGVSGGDCVAFTIHSPTIIQNALARVFAQIPMPDWDDLQHALREARMEPGEEETLVYLPQFELDAVRRAA